MILFVHTDLRNTKIVDNIGHIQINYKWSVMICYCLVLLPENALFLGSYKETIHTMWVVCTCAI